MSMNIARLLDKFFDNKMETFETAMPATVTAVNDDGTIDARPTIRNCLRNMQMEPDQGDGDIMQVRGIPVLWPGTAAAIVKFTLQEGDPVLLVASSRDTRAWVEKGWDQGTVDPYSFSGNDLNDLMAIPVRRKKHGDDPKTTIHIGSDGSVTVTTEEVEIEATAVHVTGDLTVDGEVTTNKSGVAIALSTHKHPTAAPGAPAAPIP